MAAPWRRYAPPFAHRDFRLLVTAFLVDSVGSWAASVVLAVYVYDINRSVTWLAILAAARWVPGLLIGPYAGVLADRYDRRLVMVVSAAVSGLVAVGLAVELGVGGSLWWIVVLQVLAAIVGSPYRPAAGALTPEVVGEQALAVANSLFAALENLVVVLGPAIGGVVLLFHRPVVGMVLNALSFFVAAGFAGLLSVRSRGSGGASGENAVAQFVEGVHALGAAPTAAVLLAFAGLDTVLAGTLTVVTIPISEHLGTGTSGYSYLLAASAVGGVAGAVVADRLSAGRRLAPVIVGGLLLQSLPFAITPFTHSAVVGALLQVVSGVGMVFVDVLALTAMQREIAGGLLSRVLGLLDTVVLLACVLGSFGMSALLSTVPYRAALVVLGLGIAGLSIVLAPLVVATDRRASTVTAALDARIAVLVRIPMFTGVSRPILERFAGAATEVDIAAGDTLIREGDTADALYVLSAGSLAITSTGAGGGRHAIPDVTGPDVVGEIGVLRGVPRTATVTARTACTLWRIGAEDFLAAAEPERRSMSLLGPVSARIARTHPQLTPVG